MTALTADTPRTYGAVGYDDVVRLPLIAGAKVYAGSTLSWDDAGTPTAGVEAYASAASIKFAGFALEGADNTSGALGAKIIDVRRRGVVKLVIAATVAASNVGDTVYAVTDDNSFNLTSTNNTAIGKIVRVVTAGTTGANEVEVNFEAVGLTSV